MELWIRSQNKTILSKVHDLIVREDRNENNEINYSIVDTYVLGIYKTKERALEILDEIQNRIINIQIFNKDEKALKNNNPMYPYMECVYEMPKE